MIRMTSKKIPFRSYPPSLILMIVVVVLAIGVIGGFYLGKTFYKPGVTPTPGVNLETFCTMDAKICPDGSSVGRVPPDCNFSPCPEGSDTPTVLPCGGWNTSGEIICECSGKLIRSSCPDGAQCDSGTYSCEGVCGECCYKGIAERTDYPSCSSK